MQNKNPLFGPPGCTTSGSVRRPIVPRAVRRPALTAFRTTRFSAGAFSGRPAIDDRHFIMSAYPHPRFTSSHAFTSKSIPPRGNGGRKLPRPRFRFATARPLLYSVKGICMHRFQRDRIPLCCAKGCRVKRGGVGDNCSVRLGVLQ